MRGAVLTLGERCALARLSLARRRPAAGDPAIERTGLDLGVDVLDGRPDPLGHRPGDLRLIGDGEVAPDVLEERPVGVCEVARILGEPLDALLARGENLPPVLELLLGLGPGIDEVLDGALDRPGVLIHTGQNPLVNLLAHTLSFAVTKHLQNAVNIGLSERPEPLRRGV